MIHKTTIGHRYSTVHSKLTKESTQTWYRTRNVCIYMYTSSWWTNWTMQIERKCIKLRKGSWNKICPCEFIISRKQKRKRKTGIKEWDGRESPWSAQRVHRSSTVLLTVIISGTLLLSSSIDCRSVCVLRRRSSNRVHKILCSVPCILRVFTC